MNDEAARQGRRAHIVFRQPRVATDSEDCERERLRVAIQYAIDELELGNQWAAVDLLLAALDGGPEEGLACAA